MNGVMVNTVCNRYGTYILIGLFPMTWLVMVLFIRLGADEKGVGDTLRATWLTMNLGWVTTRLMLSLRRVLVRLDVNLLSFVPVELQMQPVWCICRLVMDENVISAFWLCVCTRPVSIASRDVRVAKLARTTCIILVGLVLVPVRLFRTLKASMVTLTGLVLVLTVLIMLVRAAILLVLKLMRMMCVVLGMLGCLLFGCDVRIIAPFGVSCWVILRLTLDCLLKTVIMSIAIFVG